MVGYMNVCIFCHLYNLTYIKAFYICFIIHPIDIDEINRSNALNGTHCGHNSKTPVILSGSPFLQTIPVKTNISPYKDRTEQNMQTETLSYLKEHANHLELDGPLLVTQKGKARFVIQNAEDYEYQQETLALLKLLVLSDKSMEKETLSLDQAFDI
jgi:PHD/YefM family antitoxin component YafN of YafNO toxin-antitoxin module